jgi:hypothetical protein
MASYHYFAERAAHYQALGLVASNAKHAESLFGLSNLFLQMSQDLRAREQAILSCRRGLYRQQVTSTSPLRRGRLQSFAKLWR